MKKGFVIGLSVLMIVAFSGMAMAQQPQNIPPVGLGTGSGGSQTVDLTVNVLKFVAVNPTHVAPNLFGTIDPGLPAADIIGNVFSQGCTVAYPGVGHLPRSVFGYSNCPFSVTMSGNPCLKRQEVDCNGNLLATWDYLWTRLVYIVEVNDYIHNQSGGLDSQRGTQVFECLGHTNLPGSWITPTANLTTPHNGLIMGLIYFVAALEPNVAPNFSGPQNKSQKLSQDAGVYTGNFVATYAAL